MVPPAAGAVHPATGLGLTDTTEVKAASAAVAAASARTVATANAVDGTRFLMCPLAGCDCVAGILNRFAFAAMACGFRQ
jgi:hypothetical protein